MCQGPSSGGVSPGETGSTPPSSSEGLEMKGLAKMVTVWMGGPSYDPLFLGSPDAR